MVPTKHETANRHTAEWIVSLLTIVLIVLTIATWYLDQDNNNWVCGPVLLLMETFAIGLQSLFSWIAWKSNNYKIKTLLMLISVGILTFIGWSFYNFITKCS